MQILCTSSSRSGSRKRPLEQSASSSSDNNDEQEERESESDQQSVFDARAPSKDEIDMNIDNDTPSSIAKTMAVNAIVGKQDNTQRAAPLISKRKIIIDDSSTHPDE